MFVMFICFIYFELTLVLVHKHTHKTHSQSIPDIHLISCQAYVVDVVVILLKVKIQEVREVK